MTPAEYHATKIRAAINEARAAGVNVTLDWDQDWPDGDIHVSMFTSVHRRLPSDDGKVMTMRYIDGPFIVEGY
jgi:hypothetical protein